LASDALLGFLQIDYVLDPIDLLVVDLQASNFTPINIQIGFTYFLR